MRVDAHRASSLLTPLLGFTFRKRAARKADGKMFTGFSPGISNKAKKAIVRKMRDWQVHTLTTRTIGDTAGYSTPNTRVDELLRRIL